MKRRRTIRIPEVVLWNDDPAASECDARRRTGTPPPGAEQEHERRLRRRRRVGGFLFGVILGAGLLAALVGNHGYLDLRRARHELDELDRKLEEETRRKAYLEAEIAALSDDPYAIERIAREQLDMARPGEVVFILPRGFSDDSEDPPGEILPDDELRDDR